jgi:hypothetical protein
MSIKGTRAGLSGMSGVGVVMMVAMSRSQLRQPVDGRLSLRLEEEGGIAGHGRYSSVDGLWRWWGWECLLRL